MATNDAFGPYQPSPTTSVWTSCRLVYVLYDKRTNRKWQNNAQTGVSLHTDGKILVSPTASSFNGLKIASSFVKH